MEGGVLDTFAGAAAAFASPAPPTSPMQWGTCGRRLREGRRGWNKRMLLPSLKRRSRCWARCDAVFDRRKRCVFEEPGDSTSPSVAALVHVLAAGGGTRLRRWRERGWSRRPPGLCPCGSIARSVPAPAASARGFWLRRMPLEHHLCLCVRRDEMDRRQTSRSRGAAQTSAAALGTRSLTAPLLALQASDAGVADDSGDRREVSTIEPLDANFHRPHLLAAAEKQWPPCSTASTRRKSAERRLTGCCRACRSERRRRGCRGG